LPKEVTDKLAKALAEIVARPEVIKRFEELGIAASKMTPPEFADLVAKQVNDWAPVIQKADLKQ
jgi:tripartite-type tricarboxylate transporter receptor subunit TctC